MADRLHPRRCESLCSARHATGRSPDFESPFSASRMLVCPHNGGINHDVLEIGIVRKTLKRLFQMPLRDHRLKRVNTLFHLPNADGRSRQGAPVRKIQSTASTKRRLSSPARPLSPSLPETRFNIRDHCTSVSSRRIKIASISCDLESQWRGRGNPFNVNRP